MTAQASVSHLLIFEPDARGHAFEWIEHVLRFAQNRALTLRISLAIPRELAVRLAAWQAASSKIQFTVLSAREMCLCNSPVLAVSGISRWWTMRRHLRATGADHGLFLGIDHASLPFALGLPLLGRKISGILFRPSVHYADFGGPPPSLKERLREFRKDILYSLMLRNTAVQAVHSLDPYFPAFAAERYADGGKVRALVDPVSFGAMDAGERQPRGPHDWIGFAMFGVLTERKGVLTLLEALRHLRPAVAERIEVVIAGRIDPAIREAVCERAAALSHARGDLRFRFDDRHLAESEIAALVTGTDVILAPYQRFVGSSGVLMWAAATGRPVITQDYGLLGRLVRDHGLGLAVDTTSPAALAGAIERAVQVGAQSLGDPARMRGFASARTPARFASSLLEGLFFEADQRGECAALNVEMVQK